MELAETISFLLGVMISGLFFREYRKVEQQEKDEELIEQLLS